MSSPGVSLDSAIAGITRGVENARKVAIDANKIDSASASNDSAAAGGSADTSDSRIGGNIDVTA